MCNFHSAQTIDACAVPVMSQSVGKENAVNVQTPVKGTSFYIFSFILKRKTKTPLHNLKHKNKDNKNDYLEHRNY